MKTRILALLLALCMVLSVFPAVSAEDSILRANDRIKTSTCDTFTQTVMGYTTLHPISNTIKLENSRVRYGLYPVWVLNTRYKGKDYLFAMNGQTGKFVGNLPIDWSRFFGYWAAISASVGAAAWILAKLAGLC